MNNSRRRIARGGAQQQSVFFTIALIARASVFPPASDCWAQDKKKWNKFSIRTRRHIYRLIEDEEFCAVARNMYCVCLLKGSGHTHTWAIVIQSNGQTAEKILKRGAWEKKTK